MKLISLVRHSEIMMEFHFTQIFRFIIINLQVNGNQASQFTVEK